MKWSAVNWPHILSIAEAASVPKVSYFPYSSGSILVARKARASVGRLLLLGVATVAVPCGNDNADIDKLCGNGSPEGNKNKVGTLSSVTCPAAVVVT